MILECQDRDCLYFYFTRNKKEKERWMDYI